MYLNTHSLALPLHPLYIEIDWKNSRVITRICYLLYAGCITFALTKRNHSKRQIICTKFQLMQKWAAMNIHFIAITFWQGCRFISTTTSCIVGMVITSMWHTNNHLYFIFYNGNIILYPSILWQSDWYLDIILLHAIIL